ncbi:DUF2971 domain-containing protein [Aureibaculum sp. 2210JD6-5]|uniref:DUF2971 domain-containing protein n=1 Tax=Aureibaculum sp. 2210JD6-5 TaxID=3103957 RepID=UPI002AAE847E|nr:DUF2971 domain-containing protein [Aureibaculum sp. 2210JD6-5]MDY7396606.1 DUF2971 domain-containing protein [Aureibaculum sp. 2210JD6-5]
MYKLEKLRENFPIKMGRPFVFRFRPPNENTISELENGYIWFSDRNSLNDELDSNPEFVKISTNLDEQKLLYSTISNSILDERTKRYFDENMSSKILQEFAQTKVEPFVNSFGIACFTMYPMNEQLWEIYAKNNRGLCLQFDTSKDTTFFHNVLPIYYVSQIIELEYNPISEPDHIIDLFYKKTEKWSYEKELRLLKGSMGRVPFNRGTLESIIVGDQAEKDFVEQIIEIVKKHYPKTNIFQTVAPVKIVDFRCKLLYGKI